mmetsp:Transcript_36296/g.122901  ORF Transcript_36296/g.122901 Transcript_36296/m.122901 type:complete len:323 (+) Transcript_36296:1267-2235(+)
MRRTFRFVSCFRSRSICSSRGLFDRCFPEVRLVPRFTRSLSSRNSCFQFAKSSHVASSRSHSTPCKPSAYSKTVPEYHVSSSSKTASALSAQTLSRRPISSAIHSISCSSSMYDPHTSLSRQTSSMSGSPCPKSTTVPEIHGPDGSNLILSRFPTSISSPPSRISTSSVSGPGCGTLPSSSSYACCSRDSSSSRDSPSSSSMLSSESSSAWAGWRKSRCCPAPGPPRARRSAPGSDAAASPRARLPRRDKSSRRPSADGCFARRSRSSSASAQISGSSAKRRDVKCVLRSWRFSSAESGATTSSPSPRVATNSAGRSMRRVT